MIRTDKLNNALAALNAVLVTARKLAYEECPHQQLVDVLDAAEYLPRLMADEHDQTDTFRQTLMGLAAIESGFNFALERFDRTDLDRW